MRTRRRAEQSLRANEERLRLALEAGGLGFYDLDLVTGAATVSPEYERMLGYEAGELSLNTQDWASFVHPEDREPAQHTLGECIDGQRRQYRIEYRLRTKAGEWVWIQSVGKIASWDTAGRPQRMLGTHADITTRKQSERQLELMRLSVEFGSDAVFWVDADGSLAYVNDQACRSLGRTRGELLGLRLWQIDADVTETTWGGIWEQLCRSGEFQKETRHRRIDGGLFPVEVRARAITHDGKTYAIGLAHDITERKRAEATLVQSEERLRQAVRVSGIGIFDHNVDAGSIYWSADLRRAFGWSPDAPIDVTEFVRIVHPEDREAVEAAIACCHDPAGDGQYRADYRIVKPDGELRWIMALGQTFFEGEAEQRRPLRTVGATLDITERKTAEAALIDLNATLEQRVAEEVGRSREKDHLLIQQSRLAAMGEMIGNIAHQWRQPINALALLLTNLSDAHQYGELSRDYLDTQVGKGHKLIQRMSSTIDDFRNFFRPHRQSQPFQISAAVSEALSIVDSSFANHHIAIVFAVRDEAVTAGFVNEYTQVLLNLLSNAKEAIEGSGRQPGRVDLLLQAERGEARLTVRDNGGGIRADVMPKIFDPYFTTRDHGTGIGLYMSKMIIEANMKGRIEAANVDDGAQFTIVTPLVPGGSASAAGHVEQAP